MRLIQTEWILRVLVAWPAFLLATVFIFIASVLYAVYEFVEGIEDW